MCVKPKDQALFEALGAMEDDDTLPWRTKLDSPTERHRFRQMVKRYGRANGHEVEVVLVPPAGKAYIIAIGEAVEPTYWREKARRKVGRK